MDFEPAYNFHNDSMDYPAIEFKYRLSQFEERLAATERRLSNSKPSKFSISSPTDANKFEDALAELEARLAILESSQVPQYPSIPSLLSLPVTPPVPVLRRHSAEGAAATCRHFLRGNCTWGMLCNFSHPNFNFTTSDSVITRRLASPPTPRRKARPAPYKPKVKFPSMPESPTFPEPFYSVSPRSDDDDANPDQAGHAVDTKHPDHLADSEELHQPLASASTISMEVHHTTPTEQRFLLLDFAIHQATLVHQNIVAMISKTSDPA